MRTASASWLALFTFLLTPQGVLAADEATPDTAPLLLEHFLFKQGERLNCYFTLEFPTSRSMLEFPTSQKKSRFDLPHAHLKPFSPDSVESLVKSLREQVPEAHFLVRDSKPPVIHIRDRRLLKVEGYPLDEVLKLSFEGTPVSLSDEIERRLTNMTLMRGAAIGDYLEDPYTPVKLKEVEGSVREILTRAVPLEGYSRILWRARSRPLDHGNWLVQLKYYGAEEKHEGK